MAIPLSRLKDTVKAAALAVTNAAEELFQQGLLIQSLGADGITFTVDVFDDSLDPVTMQVSQTVTGPQTNTEQTTESPPSVSQQQSYGRSSDTEVRYEG